MADTPSVPVSNDTTDITLYWLNQSRSQRIVWLLEELNLPYKLISTAREDKFWAPPSSKDVHPLGKYPMVALNGHILAESGFIVETLIERFGAALMQPDRADEKEWLRYRYFMHYSEGSFMPPLVVSLIVRGIKEAPMPFFIKPIARMITARVEETFLYPSYDTHLSFLENELQDREFLAGGKLTGADIMMFFSLMTSRGKIKGFTQEKRPNLWTYTERLAAREAFQKAEKKTEEMEGPPLW